MADYLNIAGRIRTTASDGVAIEAQEVKDLNLNKSQQEVNADVQTELGDRYTKEETYNREEIEELVDPTNYVSVVATNLTTAVTDLLPAEGATDTIYRIGNWNGTQYDPTMYALYAWNGSAYVCLAVRSFVGEVYDISVNHPDGQGNPTPYADLAAALGTGGENIPADIRRGGMRIQFIQGTVQSSDNKYVQARCMDQNFTTDVTQWQGVDDEPTSGSANLVESGGVKKAIEKATSNNFQTEDADLDITDENIKSIVRFRNGHVKTKNFDSSEDATPQKRGLMSSLDKNKLNNIENGAQVNNAPTSPLNDSESDLAISDENYKAIVRFQNGHIKTKNFDSSTVENGAQVNDVFEFNKETDDADLDIADENLKSVVRFAGGHIKTKNFDSRNIDVASVSLSKGLLQSNINPFGITASKFFVKAAKRTYLENYYPLIIVAGQSNADGRIPFNNVDTPQWLVDSNYAVNNFEVWDTASKTFKTYNVKGMSGNGGDIAGSDGTGTNKYSFDPFFAHEWLEEYGGKLYMVRQTLGGIGIQDEPTTGTRPWTWQPDVDNIVDGCSSMCLGLMEKVKEAISYAKSQGVNLYPLCILWHQGEHDANNNDIQYFKQNLSNLIMWLRGMMLTPSLPFICAELMDTHNTSTESYHDVNVIMDELTEDDDYMQLVSMAGHYDGLTEGDIHFSSTAIQYMGTQMFNEIQKYI